MKRYLPYLLLAFFGLFVMSCDNSDSRDSGYTDNDTYPVMADVNGSFSASNNYSLSQGVNIASTDVVLVYRNTASSGSAVWQLIPKTEYLTDGRELDYNFLFDRTQVEIYTEANFDQNTMNSAEKAQYLNNQQFRIVLVPASQAADMDTSNYNKVVEALGAKPVL